MTGMQQSPPSLFRGRHFDHSIIILCIRWYITYKLSYRDLVEMMDERGVDVSHTTILRWVRALRPRVREMLASLCPTSRHFVASGRDIHQSQSPVDLPVPSR